MLNFHIIIYILVYEHYYCSIMVYLHVTVYLCCVDSLVVTIEGDEEAARDFMCKTTDVGKYIVYMTNIQLVCLYHLHA